MIPSQLTSDTSSLQIKAIDELILYGLLTCECDTYENARTADELNMASQRLWI